MKKIISEVFSKPWEVFIQRILFSVVWLIFITVDLISSTVFGYSLRRGWIEDVSRAGKEYQYSAQVVDLWATGRLVTLAAPYLYNFIYTHRSYINPDRLLESRDPYSKALLWCVTPEFAIFSLQSEDLTDTRKFPFHFWFIWDLPNQLILVPHDSFIQLGDFMTAKREALRPRPKLVFIHMSARCGSTLLTQIINSVPGMAAISENWSPMSCSYARMEGSITKERENTLLKPIFESVLHYIWEQRRSIGETPTHLAYKLTQVETIYARKIKEMFPESIQVYNTRQPKPSIKSVSKVQNYVFGIPLFKTLSGWMMLNVIPAPSRNPDLPAKFIELHKRGVIKAKDIMIYFMCINFEVALDFKNCFNDTIWFEDLVEHQESTIRRLLKTMKIENIEESLPNAIEAMKEDSQGGVITGNAKPNKFSEEDWFQLDSVHEQLGLKLRTYHSVDDMKKIWDNA